MRRPVNAPPVHDRRRRTRTRTDGIRKAVAASATDLLRVLAAQQSIPRVLQRIGTAAGVTRVEMYENVARPGGAPRPTLRFEWHAPGAAPAPLLSMPDAADHDRTWDRDRLMPFLAAGQPKAFARDTAPEPWRGLLARRRTKSVLLVPVFIDQTWWGELGIEDGRRARAWSAAALDAIRTVAEMIGAALARARDLDELADANRIVENSPVVLYRIAPEAPHHLLYLSRNVSHFGYAASKLLATPAAYLELFHPDDRAGLVQDIRRILAGQTSHANAERRLRTADGRYVWVEARARALFDLQQRITGIEGILFDVDSRRQAQDALARSSLSDPITGLANRKAFALELERAIAVARQGGNGFALHYIDLDHFKDINDVLGHAKGDDLLRAVARRLTASRRSTVDLVARFGGDEFAILQTAVAEPADAGAFAEHIVHTLAHPFDLGGEIHVTASIGISVFAAELKSAEDMLKQADVALYRAKEAGRNQFHFHSEALDTATVERVVLGGELRHAAERGELSLDYQPQVDLETGRVIGFEALMRWHHPLRGLLGPSAFVPIAEKNGTIVALGHWAFEEVCRQILAWRGDGLRPPRISINVSAEQLKSGTFCNELVTVLSSRGIAADAIELELTESVLLETTRQHSQVIDTLRAHGFALSIDDFGTGYSSLAYLRAYHFNHIKIAQTFVEDIRPDSGDLAIVRAAVSLARELGISAIAEGVETEAQLALLRQAGCRYIQGFLFSRPLSAPEAAALMRRPVLAPPQPLGTGP